MLMKVRVESKILTKKCLFIIRYSICKHSCISYFYG